MRKLFFVFAFTLLGTFVFPCNIIEEIPNTITENQDAKLNQFDIINIQLDDAGICRVQYTIYGENGEAIGEDSMMWESSTANSQADC